MPGFLIRHLQEGRSNRLRLNRPRAAVPRATRARLPLRMRGFRRRRGARPWRRVQRRSERRASRLVRCCVWDRREQGLQEKRIQDGCLTPHSQPTACDADATHQPTSLDPERLESVCRRVENPTVPSRPVHEHDHASSADNSLGRSARLTSFSCPRGTRWHPPTLLCQRPWPEEAAHARGGCKSAP